MHKVFLVEDEIVVRESIRDQVDWESSRFDFAGEASDGEMALPMIEEIRPDILITDVRMPFMDGLQLGRIVRANMPRIKILILSGYDEFEYAKEAIDISAAGYLLKPVGMDELLNALDRIADEIEAENKRREELISLNRRLETNARLLGERFLSDLSTGALSSADAITMARQYGIDVVAKSYLVALIDLHTQSEASGEEGAYDAYTRGEALLEMFVKDTPQLLGFRRNVREHVLVFKGESEEEVETQAFQICRSVKQELEENGGCTVSVALGRAHGRITGVADSLKEAEEVRNFSFIFGHDSIVHPDDTARANLTKAGLLKFDTDRIVETLRYGRKEEISAALEELLERIGEEGTTTLVFSYAVFDVVAKTARFIEELGGDAGVELPTLGTVEQRIAAGASTRDLRAFLLSMLEGAHDFRERRKENKYGDLVERAKAYIETHASDPNISLVTAAEHVNLSVSHFSTIFSHEAGTTFIDYLTSVRIKNAMGLLQTTNMRCSEIGYEVGYRDPHYFSHVFKKQVGMTPTAYRKGENLEVPR